MNSVVRAIFKRNFAGYLQNPIGYVFITLFVLLTGFAAFWPTQFFASNLATLDQLNKIFPWIMLAFVPAITMGIWAEERRQGTDELLLTMPATDFDVVFGKYLAAVAIYSIALAFSLVCNLFVLEGLGEPDLGLYFTNYFGYWLAGLAMLSIGMVASFLTTNITVSFVLSAFLNSLLVGLQYASLVLPSEWSVRVSQFSIAEQLQDFTLGVISASSVAYFVLIVVSMLYLSMVLIGRRHWMGGRDGVSLAPHYLARFVALLAGAAGLFLIIQGQTTIAARVDMTVEQLTSLHPATREIVRGLDPKKPIIIHAFVSPNVPQEYAPVRIDLLSRLHEIKAVGGPNITLYVNNTEPFQPEAERAEKAFGITGRQVRTLEAGQYKEETIFLGVAIVSGTDKVVIPFIETSTPIEYELVRSLASINGLKKRRLGLFMPYVPNRNPQLPEENAFQEIDLEAQGSRLRSPEILDELRKLYDMVELDAEARIPDGIDVLMVVQPSIMQQRQLDNLIDAVARGVPAVILQDPYADLFPLIQQAEAHQGGDAGLGNPALQRLWTLLGVRVPSGEIVNQVGYNPLRQFRQFPPEFVFVGNGAIHATDPNGSLFDEKDPISRSTQDMVFMYAGSVSQGEGTKTTFTPLVRTSKASGFVNKSSLFGPQEFGRTKRFRTGIEYTLVAHVTGMAPPKKLTPVGTAPKGPAAGSPATPAGTKTNQPAADEQAAGDGSSKKPADAASAPKNEIAPAPTASGTGSAGATGSPSATASATATATPTGTASPSGTVSPGGTGIPSGTAAAGGAGGKPAEQRPMNVVIFTDLDMLNGYMFQLRSTRQSAGEGQATSFDNVAFLCNAFDVLAGDTKFVEIRKRRPLHRTLTRIDELHERNAKQLEEASNKYQQEMEDTLKQLRTTFADEAEKLRNSPNKIDQVRKLAIFEAECQYRLKSKERELQNRFAKDAKSLERDLNESVRTREGTYKALAVFIPPIFPLLIGLAVFFSRRAAEQEGVSRNRLR